MLKRDRRWELFYGDISLEQFVDEKLPAPVFKKAVSKDVVDSFGIAYQLLIHSYYQYLFIDLAVARALYIFEMALYIRYKELNAQEWDLKKKPLIQLIDWFNERSYFEIADKSFLDHVRTTRNHFAHPKGFHFAGFAGLPWINTVVDLINGLYEEIELRKERWRSTSEFKSKLDSFVIDGAKLITFDSVNYIYESGPLKTENRLDFHQCFFSLLPIFKLDNTVPRIPLVFSYPANGLSFNGSTVDLSFGTGKIMLSNELSEEEKTNVKTFKEKIKSEAEYKAHHSMLVFDASNTIGKALRQSLSDQILQEQEFIVDVKLNVTLERNRVRPPK